MYDKEKLHALARKHAEGLLNVDKKQLRYNDIVETAIVFYDNPYMGVKELVEACDK